MNEYERSLAFKPTEAQLAYVRALPVEQLPSISVVIPSFNQGRFIRAAVDSVYAQDYPRMDVFVADGGSSDDTVATLNDLAAQHGASLRYDSRPDGGHFPGVNKGISMTTGEIVAWLNSDDMYAPGAFWNVATFFTFNVGAHVVYGRNDYVLENGEFLVPYPVDWSPMLSEQHKRMWNMCLVPQPSLFFRRHAVRLCGALNHKLLDYELWLRWQKDLPFFFMDEKLSFSRLQPNAITVNAGQELLRGIVRLVRDYYAVAPMSWCIRDAYNRRYGPDWIEGKSSPITKGLKREAAWLWLKYNVLEQPLTFARTLIGDTARVRASLKPSL